VSARRPRRSGPSRPRQRQVPRRSHSSESAAQLYAAGADYVYLPRVENARNLEPAIIAALDGMLAAHRAKIEEAEGKRRDRKEVFA